MKGKIFSIPKVVLQVHLDGGLRVELQELLLLMMITNKK
ncbi:hypothetical protein BBG19_0938 [Francisella sp. MA067296]|nr:hypothetical protein BBG19_0938 [Francisella sp. MA067296]